MSNAEFSISREDFETILSFVDLMLRNRYRPNIQKSRLLLSKIEYEMEQYENKGCDAIIELCQEMITTLYENGEAIEKAMDAFISAVNEVVSDKVFNSVYFIRP